MAEVKTLLGGPLEVKKNKFLARVGSNAELLRTPLGGSLLSLSPARERAAFSQSIADFGTSAAFGSPEPSRPR